MATTAEKTPTVASVYRDRASQLEEKARELADSKMAQRAEELFELGWRAYLTEGFDRPHLGVRYTGSDPDEAGLGKQDLRNREESGVIQKLVLLTHHSDWVRTVEVPEGLGGYLVDLELSVR
jgi:hypothetical protein